MNEFDPKRIPNTDTGHTNDAYDEEFSYETNSVVSATDCTGLTMSMPVNEYEAESYEHIYDIDVHPNGLDEKKPSR